MPAQTRGRRPKSGSSRRTAIAIDVDDGGGRAATPSATRSGLPSRAKRPLQSTTQATISSRNLRKPSGLKLPHHYISSDSDEPSDAVVVATFRSTSSKQPMSARDGTTSTKRKQTDQHSTPLHSATSAARADIEAGSSSSIDRLPTPQSLVTEESEDESKRLLKADQTPGSDNSRSANEGRPSSLGRLHSNATPQFSKSFEGKARLSASASIPLKDERFASDEDNGDCEGAEKPSKRRTASKRAREPKAALPGNASLSESDKAVRHQSTRRRLQLATIFDSSDEDLPLLHSTGHKSTPLASSSQPKRFRANLEELNNRRRLSKQKSLMREKHAKIVVMSPSPSPEPVVGVVNRPFGSDPISSASTFKNRRNARASPPSGHSRNKFVPMFSATSDESNANASDSSDAPRLTDHPKRNKAVPNRVNERRALSSSSSSSSSSESSLPPDDQDISEVEEDISLDFNPLVRDKLRPNSNSKAHRLDKLKEARAAKEIRAKKRRKGIIDSDEDVTQQVYHPPDNDEDDEAPSALSDDEDFIVTDNSDIDDDELARAERLIPTHLSKHGALTLEQHFYIFVTSVVFRYFLPKSKHYRDSPEFNYSQLQLQNAIIGLINGSITSSIWRRDFRVALDARPHVELNKIQNTDGCEGCNKIDRTASERAILTGKCYDPDTFAEANGIEEEPIEFDLGRFCAEKAYFHHSLRHYLKKTSDTIRQHCRTKSTLGDKLMGDKDDRKEQREKEAKRIVRILSSGNVPIQRQLWIELDQLMARAKHRFLG